MHQESNQLAISFDLHKPEFTSLCRSTDPQTSRDAGRKVEREGTVARHERLICEALAKYGPMTAKEIADKIDGLTSVDVSRRSGGLIGKRCEYTNDKPRLGCQVWKLTTATDEATKAMLKAMAGECVA